MKRKQARRSSIFLLELMIAILFFCLAAAVCVRLFVKSHTISQDTRDLNMALNQVSAAAEVFRSGAEVEEFLEREFPDYENSGAGSPFLVYYNDRWENCTEEEAVFCLSIEVAEEDRRAEGQFSMRNLETEEEIYGVSLETFTKEAAQ